ncbi:MAG: methanogenesis marker 16 metalloprotein [Deltaproteobacteria bacterium]|nr:methanogenesis marker 16 metalloprotein [Deltaproteobacteria bacterium]
MLPINDSRNKKRTITQINEKLSRGEAVVMTAAELCNAVRNGNSVTFEDVDVVTAATRGLMSGTYAVVSFPFREPNVFKKAVKIFFNGVEGYPGPCPNESIGIIDAVIYGPGHSRDDDRYGGGHLFRDMVAGKDVRIEVETPDGKILKSDINLDRMPHAMLHGSRHAFRNYVGFVNPGDTPVESIFCSIPLPGKLKGATACGCGEINPIQKDPQLKTIGIGTRIMLNGGTGFVMGSGTRSSVERPCLSVVADMHTMKPHYMGGFNTSAGPEVIQTWAVPIPIIDEAVLATAKILDNEIPLIITDVKGRRPLSTGSYADLWQNSTGQFKFNPEACEAFRSRCIDCPPALLCPTGAFTQKKDAIYDKLCFHCGICMVTCHGDCFDGELGFVVVEGKNVPFIQRQSDRVTATSAAIELKGELLNKQFNLTEPVEKIKLI